MSFQTCMHLFILLNTKEDNLKNTDNIYIYFFLSIQWMSMATKTNILVANFLLNTVSYYMLYFWVDYPFKKLAFVS